MIKVAMIGAENVGKSTLMNALLGRKISETMPVPGTTKWLLEGLLDKLRYQKA